MVIIPAAHFACSLPGIGNVVVAERGRFVEDFVAVVCRKERYTFETYHHDAGNRSKSKHRAEVKGRNNYRVMQRTDLTLDKNLIRVFFCKWTHQTLLPWYSSSILNPLDIVLSEKHLAGVDGCQRPNISESIRCCRV